MKLKNKFYSIFIVLLAYTSNAQDKIREYVPVDILLYDQIESMDKVFFDAYNNCDLKKQESIYSDNIEFFHDKAGLINSKSDIYIRTFTRLFISTRSSFKVKRNFLYKR